MTHSTDQWGKLIGFFQSKAIQNPHSPNQLVERVAAAFRKHLSSGMKKNQAFSLDGLIAKDYQPLNDCKIDEAIKHSARKMHIESSPLLR